MRAAPVNSSPTSNAAAHPNLIAPVLPTGMPSTAENTFLTAVKQRDIGQVAASIGAAPDLIRARDAEHRTALHLAILADPPAVLIEMLLYFGADPMAADAGGNTPLHLAAASPPADLLVFSHLVLAAGLPILFSTNAEGHDASTCALLAGYANVTLALGQLRAELTRHLSIAADPLAKEWEALAATMANGAIDALPDRVAAVGGVGARRPGLQETPLMLALEANRLDMVEWLVNQGADVHAIAIMASGEPGMPCVSYAQTQATMRFMLEHGADLFAIGGPGISALDLILVNHPRPVVDLAMEHAAGPGAAPYDVATALFMALALRKADAAEHLLSWSNGVIATNSLNPALALAVPLGAPTLVQRLFDLGAHHKARATDGTRALTLCRDDATKAVFRQEAHRINMDVLRQAAAERIENSRGCCTLV